MTGILDSLITSGTVENTTPMMSTTMMQSPLLLMIQQSIPAMHDCFMGIGLFLWILCLIWVVKDSMYRSESLLFQLFSVLLVTLLTPIVGLLIYIAIRPIGYKYERRYRKEVMTSDAWYEDTICDCDDEACMSVEEEKKTPDTQGMTNYPSRKNPTVHTTTEKERNTNKKATTATSKKSKPKQSPTT